MTDPVHLKAGDLAPDIVFTEILSTDAGAEWTADNLSGRLTILAFFPVTSYSAQLVTVWNARVDEFADRPVRFVWVTSEQPPLGPWLREHPIRGWVFLDPARATALSYGIEFPATAIIGADRRIIGFDRAVPPAQTLNAALEGRITTGFAAEIGMVHMNAEPWRPRRRQHVLPNLPPSETVHISPAKSESGAVSSSGPDHWTALGFTLRGLLMDVYGVQEGRLELAPGLDGDVRYDVALVLPHEEDRDRILDRIRRGIEQHLRLEVSREVRSMEIYVLTAPDGMAPPGPFGDHVNQEQAGSGIGAFSGSWSWPMEEVAGERPAPADLQSGAFIRSLFGKLPAIGRGFAHMSRFLPFSYGLLTVADADRHGDHSIEIDCVGRRGNEDLFRALREDLGIVATEERRDVEMLVVRGQSTAAA